MYNIIQKRQYWFILSAVLIIPSIVFIALGGLKFNIDFTGGTIWQLRFSETAPAPAEIESVLGQFNLGEIRAQRAEDNSAVIRLKPIDNETRQSILDALNSQYPGVTETSFESVGPTIGEELKRRALVAIALVLAAIILYVTWAFRKVTKNVGIPSWVMGLSAIIALVHDLLIIVGVFAALGYFMNVEIGALFVTALLTILGFSVHDTIVVFDRVRENVLHGRGGSFADSVNRSVNQTIVRSLNTSLTTLFVLVVLYLFGGASIQWFVFAMIIGIIIGTYSSIFIASPLLVMWKRKA
ncbi:MAG: protein translocase subunit SecF [bacterium]|nr:protein translocase subunit SecF [bacterium]